MLWPLFALLSSLPLSPRPLHAQCVPDPAQCTIPCGINLVGTSGGVADPKGEFTMTIRDFAGNPLAGCQVCIDFNACLGPAGQKDIRICTMQMPGLTVLCNPIGLVCGVTNAAGQVTWRVVGGANNLAGCAPGAGFKCGMVRAGSSLIPIGPVNVGAFDENSVGGVNVVDISLWLSDYFCGIYVGRDDYNCTNSMNPVDLSLMLSVSIPGGSSASCFGTSSYCF